MESRGMPGMKPGPCSASLLRREEPISLSSSWLACKPGPGLPLSRVGREDLGVRVSERPRGSAKQGLDFETRKRKLESGTGVSRLCSSLASPVADVVAEGGHIPCWVHEQMYRGCERGTKLRVAVLLSGGVDSSVALRLLVAAGHECTAYYLKIWFQEHFENFWSSCPWEDDIKYAQDVCDEVGVDLKVVHLTDEYWSKVVSHCILEIKAGRTPNPDILCNTRIKFGSFLDYISSEQFDRVASGHYATVDRMVSPTKAIHAVLKLSADEVKDQTYFLSHLSQAQLSKLLFPLGGLSKPEVREIADALNLPNKERKDSQGICFLGKVRFSEFIAKHLGESEGRLIEAETGVLLGKHNGFWFYTIGQRHGLRLPDGPWFVVAKDTVKNVVFISKNYFTRDKQRSSFRVRSLNWLSGHPPETLANLRCKVRHGPKFYSCSFEHEHAVLHSSQIDAPSWLESENAQTAMVRLGEDDQGLAPGQFAAFYSGDVCLGSGIIAEDLDAQRFSNVSEDALEAVRTGIHPDRKKKGKHTDSPNEAGKKRQRISRPIVVAETAPPNDIWKRIKESVSLVLKWFSR